MSVLPEGSKSVYEGSARAWRARPPEEREGFDEELLLRHAILDAYRNAREAGDSSGWFRVVAIFVEGSNPPSDYKIQVVGHP